MNPHITSRPLRQALYERLFGPGHSVRESIAVWRDGAAVFDEKLVESDAALGYLLDAGSSEPAFLKLFAAEALAPESDEMWEQHVFACRAVCARLWAAAAPGRGFVEELERARGE